MSGDELHDQSRKIDSADYQEGGQQQEVNISVGGASDAGRDTASMRDVRRVVEIISSLDKPDGQLDLEGYLQAKHENPHYADMIDDALQIRIAERIRRMEEKFTEMYKALQEQINNLDDFERRLSRLEWRSTALFLFVLACIIILLAAQSGGS